MKKFLSFVLTLCVTLTSLQFAAFAATNDKPTISVDSTNELRLIDSTLFGAVQNMGRNGEGAADSETGKVYPSFVEACKKIGLNEIRFPGGTKGGANFIFSDNIGPADERQQSYNQSGQTGCVFKYGVDELAGWVTDDLDGTLEICINSHRMNSTDALHYLAYLLMPANEDGVTDPNNLQYWANLRAANGHSEPYHASEVSIGNEEDAGKQGWLSGEFVSLADNEPACEITDDNCKQALYALGGVTRFTDVGVVTSGDLSTNAALSTGEPNMVKQMDYGYVVDGTGHVYVDGIEWEIVENLDSAGSTDEVCTLDSESGVITFGDGTHGAIPEEDAEITCSYDSKHEGYVDFYKAIKEEFPEMNITAEIAAESFFQVLGDKYPCDSFSYHMMGYGFPKSNLTHGDNAADSLKEYYYQQNAAITAQGKYIDDAVKMASGYNGRDVEFVATAWGHSQGSIPSCYDDGTQNWHLNLSEGILNAGQLMMMINKGVHVAHIFELNDTPFDPDDSDQTSLARYNACIISRYGSDDFVITPRGWAFSLMSELSGQTQVASTVENNPAYQLTDCSSADQLNMLDVVAAKADDGSLSLAVINYDYDEDIDTTVNLGDYTHGGSASVTTLDSDSITDVNLFDDPEKVVPETSKINVGTQSSFDYNFPAHSITLIKFSPGSSDTKIAINPSEAIGNINPLLFGGIVTYQDDAMGALDPDKVADGATGIDAFYPDYVEKLKQLGITNIRPGASTSAQCFEWKRSIGPQDERSEQRARSGKPGTSPAYGLDEMMQLAEKIGASATWVYNIQTGSAQDAANCLAYMVTPVSDDPSDDPNDPSYWANLRKENGHSEPYDVNYFDIGNEESGTSGIDSPSSSGVGWRSGKIVSVGGHTTTTESDPNQQAALYLFGGTTEFEKKTSVRSQTIQGVVGYADLSADGSVSDGSADQVFYAQYPPVVPETDTLYVGSPTSNSDDTEWTRVDSLDNADSGDRVYTIDDDTGKITFGDGEHGAIPEEGTQIKLAYQSGPHDGYVQYYEALKAVDPDIQVTSEYVSKGFVDLLGDDTYPCDAVADHNSLGYGFPDNSVANESSLEWAEQSLLAAQRQGEEFSANQKEIDGWAGRHLPILYTAYGHVQSATGNDSESHLWLNDGLILASELINYQKIGVNVAHCFLINDKPFNPNPDEAPAARRYNAKIISNGTDGDFVFTPGGLALQMMTTLAGQEQIDCEVDKNPQVALEADDISSMDALSTIAAKDDDGNISLIVVNGDLSNDVSAQVNAKDYTGGMLKITTMNGDSYDSKNTLDVTDAVTNASERLAVDSDSFDYTFPAHSLTLIQFGSKESAGDADAVTDEINELTDSSSPEEVADVADQVRGLSSSEQKKLRAETIQKLEKLIQSVGGVTLSSPDPDTSKISGPDAKLPSAPEANGLLLAAGVSGSETEAVAVRLSTVQLPVVSGSKITVDLTLTKQTGSEETETIHDLQFPVTISIHLPKNFVKHTGSNYAYSISHKKADGSLETLPVTITGTVGNYAATFTTSSFSQFSLVEFYSDGSSGGDDDHDSDGSHGSGGSSSDTSTSTPTLPSATFLSDTTQDFSVNGTYQIKITSKDGFPPTFVIGTSGVFASKLIKVDGQDYYYQLTAIGKPGDKAGVYVDGIKVLTATVGAAVSIVTSDTTAPFKVAKGKTYTFKLSAENCPYFISGNSAVFRVEFLRAEGKDYFYRVTAVGNAGQAAGFYINSSKVPCAVCTIS